MAIKLIGTTLSPIDAATAIFQELERRAQTDGARRYGAAWPAQARSAGEHAPADARRAHESEGPRPSLPSPPRSRGARSAAANGGPFRNPRLRLCQRGHASPLAPAGAPAGCISGISAIV